MDKNLILSLHHKQHFPVSEGLLPRNRKMREWSVLTFLPSLSLSLTFVCIVPGDTAIPRLRQFKAHSFATSQTASSGGYYPETEKMRELSAVTLISLSLICLPFAKGSGPLDLGPAPLRLGTCTTSWTKGLLVTQAGALPFVWCVQAGLLGFCPSPLLCATDRFMTGRVASTIHRLHSFFWPPLGASVV